jgi:hypothetical protein
MYGGGNAVTATNTTCNVSIDQGTSAAAVLVRVVNRGSNLTAQPIFIMGTFTIA